MSIFDLFKKQDKREQQSIIKQRNYSNIVDIANIITNGNRQAISDMELLAKNTDGFHTKYKIWCDEILGKNCKNHDTPFILAYWLVGYSVQGFDNPNIFGCYIDWKEETSEIIYELKKPIENLGYPLSLNDIPFTGKEFTDEALDIINNHFMKKGYNLIFQDTDSDCYHLFIVKTSDYDRLVKSGKEIDIKFSNKFREDGKNNE